MKGILIGITFFVGMSVSVPVYACPAHQASKDSCGEKKCGCAAHAEQGDSHHGSCEKGESCGCKAKAESKSSCAHNEKASAGCGGGCKHGGGVASKKGELVVSGKGECKGDVDCCCWGKECLGSLECCKKLSCSRT